MAAGDGTTQTGGRDGGETGRRAPHPRLAVLLAERLTLLRGPALRAPLAVLLGIGAFLLAFPSLAQTLTLDLGEEGGVTERALQLIALVTVLALAPFC